jgi:Flp pilus assembly protein TadG
MPGNFKARLSQAAKRFARLVRDRRGASAIEFAFLAPVLISIYVSSFEITEGYNTAGKVLKAAGAVADIVARQDGVTKSFLNEMVDTAEATIAPHSTDGLTLKITGVTIDSAGNAKVLWSWDQDGHAPYVKGSAVTVPDDMRTPSSFLVHAEVTVPHTLLLFLSSGADMTRDARTITLSREFFYRQRLSNDITCSDCS